MKRKITEDETLFRRQRNNRIFFATAWFVLITAFLILFGHTLTLNSSATGIFHVDMVGNYFLGFILYGSWLIAAKCHWYR